MEQSGANPFGEFFADPVYLSFKNHLYNYLLRKRAVKKIIRTDTPDMVLEVGSGISPVVTGFEKVVYTDISLAALQTMKRINRLGYHVVADGVNLPFKPDSFSHLVCTEVLEHIENDGNTLAEAARVLRRSGFLVLTFPHRKAFFTIDDRFVGHLRRYDLTEMIALLNNQGFKTTAIRKVLGPLEKVTMVIVLGALSLYRSRSQKRKVNSKLLEICLPVFKCVNKVYLILAWVDARMAPQRLSSVLLVRAVKA